MPETVTDVDHEPLGTCYADAPTEELLVVDGVVGPATCAVVHL